MPEETVETAAIAGLQREMREMRDVMGKVADALTRLALVEDRQHSVAQATSRILEQVEGMRERMHEGELANATNAQNATEIASMRVAVRELHVDNERQKAAIRTAVMLIRGAWVAGAAVAGVLGYLLTHFPIK